MRASAGKQADQASVPLTGGRHRQPRARPRLLYQIGHGPPHAHRRSLVDARRRVRTITIIAGIASATISADRFQSQMVGDEAAGTEPLATAIGFTSNE